MNEIENRNQIDINPTASKEQAKACQRLWSMVILYALRDARERIANTKAKNLEWAVRQEMDYFTSRDFEAVCQWAGFEIEPDTIENGLRTLRRW
ncbi:hypothetical protein [Snodgrassella communis]|uniref:hypothetical protein n=1 Tax=Snodgrassella communis TaxID=2946699 RepID=UPI000C1F0499|nr:hypothetical protein [Snodgrassella communis]PIT23616.1 hypothetical protein BGI35_01695 [Snodgrassella communis]PIT24421.1 hypothetical protein BGI35_01075 [Snodgrassella communis]PIT24533.1 hypothetical protein BGI35_01030 [Snodgrassella communis]